MIYSFKLIALAVRNKMVQVLYVFFLFFLFFLFLFHKSVIRKSIEFRDRWKIDRWSELTPHLTGKIRRRTEQRALNLESIVKQDTGGKDALYVFSSAACRIL